MKWLPLKTALGILIILAYFLLAVPVFADTEDPDQRPDNLYESEPNEGGEDNTNSGDNEGAEQDGSLNTNNQNSTVNSLSLIHI